MRRASRRSHARFHFVAGVRQFTSHHSVQHTFERDLPSRRSCGVFGNFLFGFDICACVVQLREQFQFFRDNGRPNRLYFAMLSIPSREQPLPQDFSLLSV